MGGRAASYDLANRLIRLDPLPGAKTCAPRCTGPDPAATVTLRYDAEGNRTAKSVTSASAGPVVTTYEHDLNGPLPLLAAEREQGALVRTYRYGAGELLGVGGPGGEFTVLRDGLGSTTDLVDDRGRQAWRYSYSADGSTTQEHANRQAPVNPMQFTGQYFDADLGLYDLRTRLYDPQSARFLQRDPVLQDALAPAQSSYLYADGRPTSLTDPSGACPFCVLAGVGALIGGAASAATYAVTNRGEDFSWRGLAGATVSGASAGALGALAGPAGGSLGLALTNSSRGAATLLSTGAANGAIGAGSTYLGDVLSGRDTSATSLLYGFGAGALGGYLGGAVAPGRGVNTLKQLPYFSPRTVRSTFDLRKTNTRALYNAGLVGGGVGLGAAFAQGLGSNNK